MPKITYGIAQSPFGSAMILGQTPAGALCWLGFMVRGYKGDGEGRMRDHFPGIEFIHDDRAVAGMAKSVLSAWERDAPDDIPLDLSGTLFQKKVWTALLSIPKGTVASYGDIARRIGAPRAARAVGSAVGENPVSLIVPCHRVITSAGTMGNYGWGVPLKEQILKAEGVAHSIKAGAVLAA
jgi:AraC family transcriptional regulator of adaptative response/methylated-DNA-[protein]-cysteine methyltransferase